MGYGGEQTMEMKHQREPVEFSRALIREYMEERSLKYLTDRDGDYVAIMAMENCPQKLFTIFAASGVREDVFSITIRVEPSPAMAEIEALRLVNRWNAQRRWPRAFYKENSFILDWHVDLEMGISPALFADMCDTVMRAAHQFVMELNLGEVGNLGGMEDLFRALLEGLRKGR